MIKIIWLIVMSFALLVYGSELRQSMAAMTASLPLTLAATTILQAHTGDALSSVNIAASELDPDGAGRGPGIALFDFAGREPGWYTVNDNVMGGISTSSVAIDDRQQRLIFSGKMSLENNGGFASTRSQWTPYNLERYDGIALRVRGDGNVYRFRIRTAETGTGIAYTALFRTEADAWQEVYIPFAEMTPLYRGFAVEAAGPLNPATVRSFGLMLADKQVGDFSLEVDWINAVMENKGTIESAQNQAAGPSLASS